MEIRVSAAWVAHDLDTCIERMQNTGDGFVLLENDKPVAKLVPPAGVRTANLRDLCDTLATVPVDENFSANLQSVNAADRHLDTLWIGPRHLDTSTPRH